MATDREETVELVEDMVRFLVDNPDAVKADSTSNGSLCTVRVQVAACDVGKVIGKNGRTANALRTILSATGKRQRTRYDLNIVDGDFRTYGPNEIVG